MTESTPAPANLFPAGTDFYAPDDIHRVIVQFPDPDSAVIFFEYIKQLLIDRGQGG